MGAGKLVCSRARPFCEVIQLADPTENDPFVFLAGLGSWVGSWGSPKWRAHSSGIVGVREGTQPSPFGSSVPTSPSSLDFPWVMSGFCDLNHPSDTPRQEQPLFYTGKCQFVHPMTNSLFQIFMLVGDSFVFVSLWCFFFPFPLGRVLEIRKKKVLNSK